MILFPSLTSVQVFTAIVIAAMLWFGTGQQPFLSAYRFLHSLVTSRKYLFFFIALIVVLVINTNEVRLENRFGVTYDLTSVLTGWEGTWQAVLQRYTQSEWLTAFSSFFYIVVFQSVMIASIGIYTWRRDMKLFYAFCVAILLNYALALPMYWFVPVNEAWHAKPEIRFLMLDVFPGFEKEYRGLSGINNCFPSLHTSISVTMALLAARSGIRRWAILCWTSAIVIIFSIFYLGIHWFTDMAGGVTLAMVCAWAGLKAGAWADRTTPDPDSSTERKTHATSSRSYDR